MIKDRQRPREREANYCTPEGYHTKAKTLFKKRTQWQGRTKKRSAKEKRK